MNFIIILIALSTPFWGNSARVIQQQNWLPILINRASALLESIGIKKSEVLLTTTLILLFILTSLIHFFLNLFLYKILGYVFALYILIYCIGDFAFLTSPMVEEMLREFMNDLFSVIFWFLLAGPAGALLYRAASLIARMENQDELRWRAEVLIEWMDWLPARMIAFGFAVFGHFSSGFTAMLIHFVAPARENIRYMSRCFQVVLMQEEVGGNKVLIATEYLRKLLLRISAMWFVLLFLIYIV